MRIAFVAALAFIVLSVAVPRVSHAEGGDDELKKFQGTWKVVDEDMFGESQMKDPDRSVKVMVAGDSVMIFGKQDSLQYLYTLHNFNPSATPSSVDMTAMKDEKKLGEYPAVYKLDGDDLQLCWWGKESGKPRPEKLEKGKGLVVMTLKRVK